MRRPDRPRRGRGFTLVELLVVLGILALLIGLLLPALNRARGLAKRLACLSNLRQMSVAAQAYVTENHGYYPPAYFTAFAGTTQYNYAWDYTQFAAPGNPIKVVPGLLWRSGDPLRIGQCPAFEGRSNSPNDPYTGYNYNTTFIGHDAGLMPAKAAAVRHPSRTALFGDGQYAAGADKYMRSPVRPDRPPDTQEPSVQRWAGTQGFRHGPLTNVSYCDGHADSVGERFTENADGAAHVGVGTGFLSADNSAYAID